MAAVWKVSHAQREKRIGKGKGSSTNNILHNEMVTVQRLSSDVSGKAPKCTHIGPREFVAYGYTDLTVTNLKKAITTHFGSMSFCDILAGEQDPSCKVLEQIPDLKVIYFWFVDQGDSLDEDGKKQRKAGELPKQLRRFSHNNDKDFAFGPAKPTVPAKSQFYPKSLSVLDMLKLGCPCAVVDERKAEVIQLYSFDLALMSWSVAPTSVQFILEKDPVGLSSFRKNQDGPLVLRVLLIFST